jgi:hypothetical protein
LDEYDVLLAEAIAKAEAWRATARDYVPRMYAALRSEDSNLSPLDAKDRIQKDCINIWSRRTILDALPDETKDSKKQKAGRLAQKKRNSAAFSAAPLQEKEIVIDAAEHAINRPYEATTGNDEKRFDIETEQFANELSDKRIPLVELVNSQDSTACETVSSSHNEGCIIEFEFSMPFEEARLYMESLFKQTDGRGNVWFHGMLNIRTGKVTCVSTGRTVSKVSEGIKEGTS